MSRTAQYLIEALAAATVNARISQSAVETLVARPTASPTTITGAGVSQHVIEVLVSATAPKAKVAQDVVEVLCAPVYVPPTGSGGAAVTRAWVMIS